jgi:hypothetical protein
MNAVSFGRRRVCRQENHRVVRVALCDRRQFDVRRGTASAQLPWVQTLKTGIETVEWTLLDLYITCIAVNWYILWNEGTANVYGAVLNEAILRTIMYVALGLMETAVRMIFVVLLMVGWMVVAIRGPHLLRHWIYRTGVSGFGLWVGGKCER